MLTAFILSLLTSPHLPSPKPNWPSSRLRSWRHYNAGQDGKFTGQGGLALDYHINLAANETQTRGYNVCHGLFIQLPCAGAQCRMRLPSAQDRMFSTVSRGLPSYWYSISSILNRYENHWASGVCSLISFSTAHKRLTYRRCRPRPASRVCRLVRAEFPLA